MNPYEELAYAVCKSACDEYIDALILKGRGWLDDPKELESRRKKKLRKLWRHVIKYGDRRYIYRAASDNRIIRQTQEKNREACEKIRDLIDDYVYLGGPDKSIHDCEEFFRSNRFSIFMPNIDPEDLIRSLREKAAKGERTTTTGRQKAHGNA